MKKIILLIVFLFSVIATAQDYPGKKPELLIGKEVIVASKPFLDSGFSDFYTSVKLGYDDVYEPTQRYSSYSKTEALAGKKFKVAGVEKIKHGEDTKILLKLEGEGMPVLYFKYDPDHGMDFPFKVAGGLTLPKGFYCNAITKDGNNFSTDIADGVSFYKTKANGQSKYFVSVSQSASSLKKNIKGATIVLSGNKKIQKDAATITVDTNGNGGFYYTSTFALTTADIALLKTNKIISTTVYVYESEVTSGEKLKGIFNCLITK